MIKIGLISDTHISRCDETLPSPVREIFQGVDLILHGGDIYVPSVLDELEIIAPVLAVYGNGDGSMPPDPRLKNNLILNFFGFRIGVTHGLDYPEPSFRSLEDAMQYEFGGRVDIFIFGDSHVEVTDIYKGVLHVNPGSPTFPHQIKRPGTVALLELSSGGEAKAWIVSLSTRRASRAIRYNPDHFRKASSSFQ
ncbi:metallophosphoesterase family protein [Thermodesulfobacteriota bacterium]